MQTIPSGGEFQINYTQINNEQWIIKGTNSFSFGRSKLRVEKKYAFNLLNFTFIFLKAKNVYDSEVKSIFKIYIQSLTSNPFPLPRGNYIYYICFFPVCFVLFCLNYFERFWLFPTKGLWVMHIDYYQNSLVPNN